MKLDQIHKQIIVNAARAAGLEAHRISAMLAAADGRKPNIPEGPALLTQAQKARQLGVSRFTIRKMVAAGKLTPIELLPGLLRYRSNDVVETE
jgi:hypothetical protein